MKMEHNGFNLGCNYKAPTNTIGFDYTMFYPTIEGIEIGAPCDSAEEALEEAKSVLTQQEPLTLIDYVEEDIEYYTPWLTNWRLTPLNKTYARCRLKKLKLIKSKLIN